VLFPALRLGYMVVPLYLVDAFVAARALADRHSSSLDQAVLADFIAEGVKRQVLLPPTIIKFAG